MTFRRGSDFERNGGLRVDVYETIDALELLAPEWSALESRTPEATGFQNFDWCAGWLRAAAAHESPAKPRVVAVREDGRLVMLWPLQIERRWGAAIARWAGEPLTQYGDALAEPGPGRARWRAAAEAEMTRWRGVDLIALTHQRADGVLASCGGEMRVANEGQWAPFLDLPSGGGAVAARRHKSLERRARRLEAQGAVTLDELADPVGREAMARRALAMKRAWLDAKGLISVGLSNPAAAGFLADLARNGRLQVHCLRVAGEPAAIDLGFSAGGVYRSLLSAFDARFAQGSPGHALTARLIERCAARGISRVDLLAPADPYKLMWTSGATAIGERYVPLTLTGRAAAFALARLRPLAKRLVRALARLRGSSRLRAADPDAAAGLGGFAPIPLSRRML